MNPNIGEVASTLTKKFNIAGFLDGTQKTLNVINQAIPIFYQVKPLINNVSTLFKIGSIIKEPDDTEKTSNEGTKYKTESNANPIFYV